MYPTQLYLDKLTAFTTRCESMPKTRMMAFLQLFYLTKLIIRYKTIELDQTHSEHPYKTTASIIDDALAGLNTAAEVDYIEDDDKMFTHNKSHAQEIKHSTLWAQQCPRYTGALMESYISRYLHRIRINSLEPLISGKRILDMGCGNGAFLFACLQAGAASVAGIDFGKESIDHALNVAQHRHLSDRCEFHVSTVYDSPFANDEFDFVIQNAVFHHLDHPDKAIKEATRVLKPRGHMWYYVCGVGAIKNDLLNAGVYVLRDVPTDFIISTLRAMNISEPKTAYLNDGFGATYAYTTWDQLSEQLTTAGFKTLTRLVGGFETDFDYDVISADPYGKEKFGEGDLRLVAQKA